MDLDPVSLRAGCNYLQQSAASASSLTVPAGSGAAIVDPTSATAAPITSQAEEAFAPDGATVLSLAVSPAAPELLALAHSGTSTVQLWRTSKANAVASAVATLQLADGPDLRQLVWHPHRRLLCVARPDTLYLFEIGRSGATTPSLVRHELALPEHHAGALHACCWGVSGNVLAAACDGEVVLYRWALLGLDWGAVTTVRFPVVDRRLCALTPLMLHSESCEEDDDDDEEEGSAQAAGPPADAFALGLGLPICIGDAADLVSNGQSRRLDPDEEHRAARAATSGHRSPAEPEMLDLRGRIGGPGSGASTLTGGGGLSGLLDLSDELAALRPPAAVAEQLGRPVGQGALQLCGVDRGLSRLEALHANLAVDVAQPDLLASAAATAPLSPTPPAGSRPLLAVASSAGGKLLVFSCCSQSHAVPPPSLPIQAGSAVSAATRLVPLCVLSLPDGYRARGLSFLGGASGKPPQLYALGGRRQQPSVVFSSPRSQQQVLLCVYDHRARSAATAVMASAASAAETVSDAAPPPALGASVPGTMPPPSARESVSEPALSVGSGGAGQPGQGRSRGATTAAALPSAAPTADLGGILGALQAHLDGRFGQIDAALAALGSRLDRVEGDLRTVRAEKARRQA